MSVYFMCVSRFFQWIKMSNKEFISNFAVQMEIRLRNHWKCYRRLIVNWHYQKHVHMSGTVYSKAVKMWWKICLALAGHKRLQLKLTSLKWRKWWLKIAIKFKRDSRWTFCVSWINLYHFKRLFGHETCCCSTSSKKLFHKAIIVNEFLTKNSTNIIEQPPYPPDMVPADFFLLPKLKLPLRGTRFQSIK